MSSILKVDTIQDQSGNNIINENADTITIGASGDTITIPSGATFDASNATVTIPAVNLTTGVTGTLPVANGGTNLTSGFANGITMADQWRLTTNFTGDVDPISSNLERVDTAGQGTLGTGMTESSGVFSFPSTGIYLVQFNHMLQFKDGNALYRTAAIQVTTNNSTYTVVAQMERNGLDEGYDTRSGLSLIDVTDIANVKVSFKTFNMSANDITVGQTTRNDTYFTFIRLGDT
jgi:hypothetical protein